MVIIKAAAINFEGHQGHKSKPRLRPSVGVVVLHSVGGSWVLASPLCGRGCGGAVALEGRGVYLPWAETLYCDPEEGCSSTGRAKKMWAWRTDKSWLREKWKDIHDWFAGRLAPKMWRESLARFALDNRSVETAKEKYSPW